MTRPFFLLTLGAVVACAQDGAAIYRARCAQCHDAPTGRVSPFSALGDIAPAKLVQSIETGVMKAQAEGLTSADRYALVGYIAYPAPKVTPPSSSAFCDSAAPRVRDVMRRWTA
jgi:mono/diheme cytochrome c family protein